MNLGILGQGCPLPTEINHLFLSFSNVQIRTKNRNDPLIPSSRGITNQRNLEIDSWTKLWTVTSKQKFLHRRDLHRNLENILKFRFSI